MPTRDAKGFAKGERPRGERTHTIGVRVNDEELERIRRNADDDHAGSVSAMLRARGIGNATETRFVEVHVPEAGEAALQLNAMRLELASEGRNLASVAHELKRASDRGTLDRPAAAKALREVMSAETWLRACEGELARMKPVPHVLMRFLGEDYEGHRRREDANRYEAVPVGGGGADGD